MTLEVGTMLGPYRVARKLGAGGMGEVYAALDPRLGREVAIKVLPKEMVRDAESLRRFQQEANTVAALNHTNIVQIFDVGSTEDGSPFLVMELLDGESLRARMNAQPMPLRKVVDICTQLARALGAAHAKSIVHRDLKPENVYLIKQGPAKILDFGLAKLSHKEEAYVQDDATRAMFTKPGMVMGTVGYMAPEQVEGLGADGRSDIFALGVMMWEMLSGRRPFHKDSSIDTLHAILREEPPEISPDLALPISMDKILRRCLEKNPDDRFQSAYDLAFQLETLTDPSGSAPTAHMSAVHSASAGSPWYRMPHRLFYPLPIKLPAKLRVCFWDRVLLSIACALLGAGCVALLMAALGHPPFGLRSNREFAKAFKPAMDVTGNVQSAAISRDGNHILVAMLDEAGKPSLLYRQAGQSTMALEKAPADEVLALSNTGSALLRSPSGDLYQQEMGENASALKIATHVQEADLTPDASKLALLRRAGDKFSIEFPLGNLCHSTQHRLLNLKVSPKGDALAFFEREPDSGLFQLKVWRAGKLELWKGGPHLCPKGDFSYSALRGMAWNADGSGLYLVVGDVLALLSRGGAEILHRNAGSIRLSGATLDGPLLTVGTELVTDRGLLPGSTKEADLGWMGGSLNAISNDGQRLLVTRDNEVWLLPSDHSKGRKIGTGIAETLSGDGRRVLFTANDRTLAIPTEGGDSLLVATRDQLKALGFAFAGEASSDPKFCVSDDGKWILITQKQLLVRKAMDASGPLEKLEVAVDGLAADWRIDAAATPDGTRLALQMRESGEQRWAVLMNAATHKQELRTQLEDGERLMALQKDSQCLTFTSSKGVAEFRTLDLKTGQRWAAATIVPPFPSTTARFRNIRCSASGAYYGYRYSSSGVSQLMIASGF